MSEFLGQMLTLKIPTFRVDQMAKTMTPLERARNPSQENGIVWYVSMKTYRDMNNRNFIKSDKTAESAN